MSEFKRPRAIQEADDGSSFTCDEPSLENWLRERAVRNEANGSSRTFVSIESESNVIAGYYCTSASALVHEEAPGVLRRNSPNPIPVILIGRLAVDNRFQGNGLGASLLQDAMVKGIQAAQLIGSRAFVVHAISERAASFYAKWGFQHIPHSEKAMYVLLPDAEETVRHLI